MLALRSLARQCTRVPAAIRSMSTATEAAAPKYTAPASIQVPTEQFPAPKVTRKNLIDVVSQEQVQRANVDGRMELFSRKNPNRIHPGSVLLVETLNSKAKESTSTFMGVVIAIRRKGLETTFTLRNLVMKVGVEQRFALYSPMLKSIKVLQPAGSKDTKFRRAKLFYLRDQPGKAFQSLQSLWKQEQAEKVAAKKN
ncbi:translation protein SH3-like domain-containing protein [Umbelopsis sp. AD052]|nr:translation protein SH3-like domain-containing protein [Umbelopsis sp. AD052]